MRPVPPLERIVYVPGCDLLRRDLASSVAYEARMLALHIVAVHRTWGVGRGLVALLASDAKSVRVSSGFGFSSRGDPIALSSASTIDAPPAPPGAVSRPLFDLVLTRAAGPWEPCETPGTCTGGVVRFGAQPALAWAFAGDATLDPVPPLGHAARDGDAIPLGRFERASAGTLKGPDNSQRRAARGPVRPFVGSGTAKPGALEWSAGPRSLSAAIDTSSAGFSAVPTYIATLVNDPWSGEQVLGPFISIGGKPTATSFTLQLHFAPAGTPAPTEWFAELAKKATEHLTVSWIGLERTVDCG